LNASLYRIPTLAPSRFGVMGVNLFQDGTPRATFNL